MARRGEARREGVGGGQGGRRTVPRGKRSNGKGREAALDRWTDSTRDEEASIRVIEHGRSN